MKCFNCSASAIYWVTDKAASDVYYCRACLPKHLVSRADAGQFNMPVPPKTESASKKKKTETPVVEETSAESSEVSDENNAD